jgi:hypothetical protein
MANERVLFITTRAPESGVIFGSSLYLVTAHWVLRCSGNNASAPDDPDERESTTFIRKRDIVYQKGGATSSTASVGASPVEGGHTGNAITVIIKTGDDLTPPAQAPAGWVATNGVSWDTAVAEINAAIIYAQQTQDERASRVVGSGLGFHHDD